MKKEEVSISKIDKIRHSLAHLLADAVLDLYPNTLHTIGPAIDNGFYYDFDFLNKINEEDLEKIDKKMREILKQWKKDDIKFIKKDIDEKEAKALFADNKYKLDLIDEIIQKKEALTIYLSGSFSDLCRGGHIESIKDIPDDSWKLSRLAGAYWKGSEKNKMLTRIYGLAFESKKELDDYEKMILEAEKNDHRKLGKELDLFIFDDDVGAGLPLWTPKGSVLVEELEKLAKEKEFEAGYKRVRTPHIAKESMYLKSGHLPYYQESMFSPMECEGEKYYLKAMNCPHHHKLFGSRPRSYRELPLRLAEYGTCYRYEKSGELFGLMRVRMLQMNDAHIYCSEEQFGDEFRKVNEMYLKYFELFGIRKYIMRLSTHDPKKLGEKFVNEPKLWKKTEDMVRNVLIESKIPFKEVPNEAAFYGPKIDVEVWSAIGREFTLATNQVDFAVPKKFDLTYKDKDGKDKTPLCIHRAPLGTHERFIGFLIEHYAGNFPLWLSPVQVKIIPVNESNVFVCQEFYKEMIKLGIRAEIDDGDENFGKKIRRAKEERTFYTVIIGDKDMEKGLVTLESRDLGNLGQFKSKDLLDKIVAEIKERK